MRHMSDIRTRGGLLVTCLLIIGGFLSLADLTRFTSAQTGGQKPEPASNRDEQEIDQNDVISIRTSEVLLPVTVRDANGRLVTDLQRKDFRVFEDGREQPLNDLALRQVPVDVVLMIDTSSSVATYLDDFSRAVEEFAQKLEPEDRISLIKFDDRVELVQDWTQSRFQLRRALRRITPGMFTRFNDALFLAAREQLGRARVRRVEDLAGVVVVLTIFASAVVAGYESINRFFHPKPVSYLWAVSAAAIIGFLGNEGVAIFRIKVGKEMGSAALVADGYHARIDGIASLSVLLSVIGVWLGYPLADPIIGLLMTALILRIVWESAQSVFTRLLDGVSPEVIDEIKEAANHTSGVENVTDVRVRWLGHRLHAELNIAVNPECSVSDGHELAMKTRHELLHKLPFLSGVTIHVDPTNASGEEHHHIIEHAHDGLPSHSHL